MKKKCYHFILSAILYYALVIYAKNFLVFPPQIINVTAFLPPILGFMFGPAAAFGVTFGDLLAHLTHFSLLQYNEIISTFFAAYFPYKIWHSIWVDDQENIFAFNTKRNKRIDYRSCRFCICRLNCGRIFFTSYNAD